jgi:hypothetical protein
MEQAFHVPRANGVIIKGGREVLQIEDCLLLRSVMQLTFLISKAGGLMLKESKARSKQWAWT